MDDLHRYFLTYLGLAVLYAACLIVWGVNWYKRRGSSGIPLHRYIGFTLTLQCVTMIIAVMFYPARWHEQDEEENRTKSYTVAMIYQVTSIVAGTIFYSLLILIALGWCIIENTLSTLRIAGVVAFVVVFIIVELVRVLSGSLSTLVTMIYVELILCVGMLIFVIVKTNHNIRKLVVQIRQPDADQVDFGAPSQDNSVSLSEVSSKSSTAGTAVVTPEGAYSINGEEDEEMQAPEFATATLESGTPMQSTETLTIPEASEKLKLFQYFYKLFALYIFASALVIFFSTSALATFIGLYLDFVFLCGVCYVFRLRDVNQYFYLVNQE